MNAQQIAALGEITKQAIADAVAPLVQRVEQAEKQSQFLAEHYAQETAKILQHVAYDDTELRKQLEELAKSIPAAYDDTALRAEVVQVHKQHTSDMETLLIRIKELAGRPMPTPADGRDALQLEILPAIDETKSYPRGTYAKHAGGLWRSFEQTSGMRGWECIVNGVKSVDARWEGKTLIETTTLSDGSTHETRKSFAVQEYKGVFTHGDHEQGDTVTWAGSLWHCNKTGTKAKPGDGSADWTLAVKKGRDGREVVKTERKHQPVQINNGENNDSI